MATDARETGPADRPTAPRPPSADPFHQATVDFLDVLQRVHPGEAIAPSGPGRLMLDGLRAELLRRLEETVLDFADTLRDELSAWAAAGEVLDRLAVSPFLPGQSSAQALRGELRLAGDQAARLIEAIETVCSPAGEAPDRPAHPPPAEPVPPAAAPAPAAPPDRPAPHGAGSSPAAELLQHYLRLGEGYRRAGDFRQSVAWHTEAIRLDPGSPRGYALRAQVLFLAGRFGPAVEDLTAALDLAPADPALYYFRGSVLARMGLLDRALDDYGRAPELQPDLLLPRHNRAVLFHRTGDHARALTEFGEVLRPQPGYAAAYYNRGLVFLLTGEYGLAVADFTRALELAPGDPRAEARLREAIQLRDAANTPASQSGLDATHPTSQALTAPHRPLRERPKAQVAAVTPPAAAPAPVTPEPKPAPHAAPAAAQAVAAGSAATAAAPPGAAGRPTPGPAGPAKDKDAAGRNLVKLVCPDCGALGSISWDRMGHILSCKGCSRFYRVGHDGQMVGVKRTRGGGWVEIAAERQSLLWRVFVRHRPLTFAAALLLLCLGLVCWGNIGATAAPSEIPLPVELDARAELLGKAWLKKDLPLIRRLTLSTYEKTLFGWLRRHAPPLQGKVDDGDLEKVRVEVQMRRQDGQRAGLLVRFHGLAAARTAAPVEFYQTWEEREGVWLLLPLSR